MFPGRFAKFIAVPGRGVGHGDTVRSTLGTAASDSESGSGSPGREAPGVRPSRPSLPETRQRSGFHGSMTSHSLVRYRKRWDQYESPLRPETQLVWILLRLLGLTARLFGDMMELQAKKGLNNRGFQYICRPS